jgi:2,3-dihydroxybenzoate decarboxylase
MAAQRELLATNPADEPGFTKMWGDIFNSGSPQGAEFARRLVDLGELRLKTMDDHGVAMQVISITSPGVQIFDADKGTALAKQANDRLIAAVRAHPTRFAGLAAIAPQNPSGAASELERAVKLGLKGALINSHTKGEYLDDQKYWEIFAKAQELDVPIYIHPRSPSPEMVKPFQKYTGLEAATLGFAAETSLHAVRLILSGVFDDYPRLKIILGHMGEGIPFWLDRIDNRNRVFSAMNPDQRKLRKEPSEYFRENFYITTSGMDFEPALMLCHKVLGPDRILFAIDYPYEESENPVRVLDEAPMSDDDKAKIYSRNSQELFRLMAG